jgi:endonuclease/exonuclease/phosphatase family metal-dependent hydrolase
MENIRLVLSKRLGRNISLNDIKKCILSSGIDLKDLEDRLKYNYSMMIPSAWLLKLKNTSRDILLREYVKDTKITDAPASRGVNFPVVAAHGLTYSKPKHTIRLATYNVHYWSDPYQNHNIDNILSTIHELGADILAIQEALMPYNSATDSNKLSLMGYEDEIQSIPETHSVAIKIRSIHSTDPSLDSPTTGWNRENLIDDFKNIGFHRVASSAASTTHAGPNTFFGNAVLSSGHREFDMEKSMGLTLPAYGQGRSATIVFFSEIKIEGTKHKGILVVSVHLDVFDESGGARKMQLAALINSLNNIENSDLDRPPGGGIPIIVMGDFNALKKEDYIESEIQWLRDNNQRSPLEFETIKQMEVAGFKDVFHTQNPCALKSTTWAARRVDYIFTRGVPDDSIFATYVHYSDASDHIPIMVDIKIDTSFPKGIMAMLETNIVSASDAFTDEAYTAGTFSIWYKEHDLARENYSEWDWYKHMIVQIIPNTFDPDKINLKSLGRNEFGSLETFIGDSTIHLCFSYNKDRTYVIKFSSDKIVLTKIQRDQPARKYTLFTQSPLGTWIPSTILNSGKLDDDMTDMGLDPTLLLGLKEKLVYAILHSRPGLYTTNDIISLVKDMTTGLRS